MCRRQAIAFAQGKKVTTPQLRDSSSAFSIMAQFRKVNLDVIDQVGL